MPPNNAIAPIEGLTRPRPVPPVRVLEPGRRAPAGAALTGNLLFDWWLALWRNRIFLAALVRRDISLRYRGSALGFAWLVLVPLASMGAYLMIFGGIFSVRFGGGLKETAFSIWLGVLCWQFISESAARSATALYENVPYVKRVPFPLALLPAVNVLTAGAGASVSLALFVIGYLIFVGAPPVSWLAGPIVLAPILFTAIAMAWSLAAIGAFVRDVRQAVPLALTLAMFLTPVLYPLDHAPPKLASLLRLNPLTHVFENIRTVIITGDLPSPVSMAAVLAVSFACAVAGYAIFKLREWEYADVV